MWLWFGSEGGVPGADWAGTEYSGHTLSTYPGVDPAQEGRELSPCPSGPEPDL